MDNLNKLKVSAVTDELVTVLKRNQPSFKIVEIKKYDILDEPTASILLQSPDEAQHEIKIFKNYFEFYSDYEEDENDTHVVSMNFIDSSDIEDIAIEVYNDIDDHMRFLIPSPNQGPQLVSLNNFNSIELK